MRILALDTATAATAVALASEDGNISIEARDDPEPGARPGHARLLLPLVQHVLDRSGAGWDAVDRIAVGTGPGTFTGLRIGIATAQALSAATGIPLVGVSTLAALALMARLEHPELATLAVIDARRGEAFAAAWPAGGAPASAPPALEPSVLTPSQLQETARRLAGEADRAVLAIGDGAIKFRELLERAGQSVPTLVPGDDSGLHRVSARAHCRLAAGVEPGPREEVQPLYLRVPDAELNLGKQ